MGTQKCMDENVYCCFIKNTEQLETKYPLGEALSHMNTQ